MMPAFPVAYFLTWGTYATWLHGDGRGSVDRSHNKFGWPVLPVDSERCERERRALRHDALSLTNPMRRVVRDTIVDRCGFLELPFAALNVRTTHVHLVVRAKGDPDRLLGGFKARATRLVRESGLLPADRPVWAEGGSTRWLWDPEAVAAATGYVLEEQGPVDEFAVRGSGV